MLGVVDVDESGGYSPNNNNDNISDDTHSTSTRILMHDMNNDTGSVNSSSNVLSSVDEEMSCHPIPNNEIVQEVMRKTKFTRPKKCDACNRQFDEADDLVSVQRHLRSCLQDSPGCAKLRRTIQLMDYEQRIALKRHDAAIVATSSQTGFDRTLREVRRVGSAKSLSGGGRGRGLGPMHQRGGYSARNAPFASSSTGTSSSSRPSSAAAAPAGGGVRGGLVVGSEKKSSGAARWFGQFFNKAKNHHHEDEVVPAAVNNV
eukprot:PhM_4_TR14430/c0_g2_i1/m.76820